MPERTTVLYLDHSAIMSGGEIALYNLVCALDKSRFEPVVGLFTDGPLREKLEEAGVETHVIPLDPRVLHIRKDSLQVWGLCRCSVSLRHPAFVYRLYRFVKRRQPAIIHTNSLKADFLGGLAGRLAGVPVIWHIRDRIASDYMPAAAATLVRRAARYIPRFVIANSRATLASLITTGKPGRDAVVLLPETAAVVHSGLPPEAFHPPGSPNSYAQAAAVAHDGLPSEAYRRRRSSCGAIIGLVGRIAPWKGQHIFLEAASRVRARFPEARFMIVGAPLFGEHDYEQRVHQQCAELGLDEVVEFTGHRNDVPDLISQFTILVHASTVPEPFGQVVLEGMVAGKPVVATRGGGVPEIVVDGETGILVPMGDSTAMAEAIIRLLGDPERAQAMGEAGRQRALTEFTIDKTARQIEAVYDQILRTRRR